MHLLWFFVIIELVTDCRNEVSIKATATRDITRELDAI